LAPNMGDMFSCRLIGLSQAHTSLPEESGDFLRPGSAARQ
jgi:hypothetical protein